MLGACRAPRNGPGPGSRLARRRRRRGGGGAGGRARSGPGRLRPDPVEERERGVDAGPHGLARIALHRDPRVAAADHETSAAAVAAALPHLAPSAADHLAPSAIATPGAP